ncbi:hypothetical protein NQ318_011741 [Aromia moschata]|uniref:PiggyBac transposable element-derived protein domain-containing protein n=1 Tax=Aromia moschata TaxID=1265417 RepID=A0AAV8XNS6_9CUCU|nr:hypothetical protein NQ318_011741 [Aromia moschata]
MRENRVPKSCTLPKKGQVAKTKKRGDIVSNIDKEDGIILVKWMDNKVVAVASTCHCVNPTIQLKRYSQAEKKIVQVPQPRLNAEYNEIQDFNPPKTVVVGNFHLASGCFLPLTQLQFRREISQAYLTKFGVAPKGAGKQTTARSSVTLNRVSDNLRYDRLDHLLT